MTDMLEKDDAVEAVARALFDVEWSTTEEPPSWDGEDDGGRAYWLKSARAALAAMPDDRASIIAYLTAEAKRRNSRIEKRVLNIVADAIKGGLDRI